MVSIVGSKFKDINIQVLTNVVVMSVDSALLVDTIPSSEQTLGNAWAARMLGFGDKISFKAFSCEVVLSSFFCP